MVKKDFIPDRGDLIKLSFDPQKGHEQAGWRPGLVISNKTFNEAVGMAFICPITNTTTPHPFHLNLPKSEKINGVIMVEQMKCLDYGNRNAKYSSTIDPNILKHVQAILKSILRKD